MHFSFKLLILLFNVLIFENVFGQRTEGDSCSLPSSMGKGICKLISSCQSTVEALENEEILPKYCGVKNKEPIICCADGSVSPGGATTAAPPIIATSTTRVNSTTKRIRTTPSTTKKVNLKVGDKSKQKCKEYEKYSYQRPGVFGIIDSSPIPQMVYCPIAVVETIVGGQPAKLKEFPHMAAIGFEDDNREIHYVCGGSLISETFVLSAGHCGFHTKYQKPKYILLGELELNSEKDEAKPQKIRIKEIIFHPKYTPFSRYHDIALFRLQNEPVLNTYIRPACLNTNPTLTNRLGVASGWGHTTFRGQKSDALLKVALNMFTNADCKNSFRKNNKLARGIDEETQLCAGSRTESKDTCQGDSGGPLQIRNADVNCAYNIIGVTSFGKDCGEYNPGVYTRVSAYIKWIEDTVWP